jgi:hypothetical protein
MRGLARRVGRRRGATMVLTAVMMTAMLGFVALAVDTMVIAVARHQAGISADSGALAGAAALADERRINPDQDLDVLFTSARQRARQFSEQNHVLGRPPVVMVDGGDVTLGYIQDPTDPASPFQVGGTFATDYNSIRVRVARSADRGGLVPAFFSRALGFEGSSVGLEGTASALNYSIAGFTREAEENADLMPFTLDAETYKEMINPNITTSDNFSINPETGAVTHGPDGIKESVLFPVSKGPGNWGTVNIGVSNNSTNTLRAQILNGVTPAQLATYPGGKLSLNLTDGNGNNYVMLGGNPGISAGMKSALDQIIGQPRTIPIYESSSGNGNNMQYKIVDFASIRVMAVNFQGNPKFVIVQPALTRDPSAIPGEVQSGWSAGGLIRLNLTR